MSLVLKKIINLLKRTIVKDTIKTTFWSILGKAAGFVIPFFIAFWFGVSYETDAFFFAYGIILFISSIFGIVVESIIVPYIVEENVRNKDPGRFIVNIIIINVIGVSFLLGLFLLTAKPILSIITPFESNILNLIYQILLITSPLFIFSVCSSILSGALNAYKKFIYSPISHIVRAFINLVIIFYLKNIMGVIAIALGYVAGEFVRLILLLIIIMILKVFKLKIHFKLDIRIKNFIVMSFFPVVGMAIEGLNPVIDKTMSSWLGEGSVSVLQYANYLYFIPISFITTGLLVILLSHWSSKFYQTHLVILKNDIKRVIKLFIIIIIPLTILLIIFHKPFVSIAFGRGLFDLDKIALVGWIWSGYLLGLLPYMIARICIRFFVIIKRTRIILLVSIIKSLSNIIFNFIFMKIIGIVGIAFSTTLVSMAEMIIYLIVFKKIQYIKNNQN